MTTHLAAPALARLRLPLHVVTSGAMLLAFLSSGQAQASTTVAEPFRAYYEQHQGMRILGYPITGLIEANGYQAQHFEKGRQNKVGASGTNTHQRHIAHLCRPGPPPSIRPPFSTA